MTVRPSVVKAYVVTLSVEERERLIGMVQSGKPSALQLTRARILLKADNSALGARWGDSQIAAALDTSVATVARTCQQLVEEGLEAALTHSRTPPARGQLARLRHRSGSGRKASINQRGETGAAECPTH